MGCGKSMAEIKDEIARLQQAAQAQAVAAQAAARAQAQVAAGQVAGGQGAVAGQPTTQGPTCPSYGAPIKEGDAFCMNCGQKLG